jgi:hypothetical protein
VKTTYRSSHSRIACLFAGARADHADSEPHRVVASPVLGKGAEGRRWSPHGPYAGVHASPGPARRSKVSTYRLWRFAGRRDVRAETTAVSPSM